MLEGWIQPSQRLNLKWQNLIGLTQKGTYKIFAFTISLSVQNLKKTKFKGQNICQSSLKTTLEHSNKIRSDDKSII